MEISRFLICDIRRGSHEFYGAGRGVSTSEEGRALAIYQPQSVIWWNDNNTLVPIVRRRGALQLSQSQASY